MTAKKIIHRTTRKYRLCTIDLDFPSSLGTMDIDISKILRGTDLEKACSDHRAILTKIVDLLMSFSCFVISLSYPTNSMRACPALATVTLQVTGNLSI